MLEAVTKDQLNTGLTGQIRYRVSERNLYAYLFGAKQPDRARDGLLRLGAARADRQLRGAAGEGGRGAAAAEAAAVAARGVSINDLRKNLRELNEHMDQECRASAARYGIVLEASLITGIDPPPEVESALAAINTAYNQVSSDISLAQASADQKIVQSRARGGDRDAESPGRDRAAACGWPSRSSNLKASGPGVLDAYVRNVRLELLNSADRVVMEGKP